jgi:hypothetical protein
MASADHECLSCKDAEREQLLALGGAGLRHVAHGGSCVAYYNYVIRFLDTQRTILVLTNYPGVPGPRIWRIKLRKSSLAIEIIHVGY